MTALPQQISLIGVPTDIGASTRGIGMGPAALRVARLAERLSILGAEVYDCGDVLGPMNPDSPPAQGHRHLEEVIAWNRALHDAVYKELLAGKTPLVMGGDHSVAIGSISAVSRFCRDSGQKLKVIWLDAHADFNTAQITPSGNLHGMPVACLCGHGPLPLTRLSGDSPALHPGDIRLVGIRSVDDGEKRHLHEQQVPVFDMRRIDERGMRSVMESVLAEVQADTHLHVSFDVDFLDPMIAPGVGTTVRGGPSYREAQLCMEMIADTGRLASMDVVELNPALDVRNATASVAVEMIESLFGKSTLHRIDAEGADRGRWSGRL